MCKTQYASIISDYLVQCHTSLVRLLDVAIAIGLKSTYVTRRTTGIGATSAH
ncbi:MAG: hypothetical protein U5K74_14315 [Gemmatimonadaceae bacterium]|nr:hypothetical protein [Gemmatimonadaceae bacterium]